MAETVKNCNIEQAFNFQKDGQQTVGHLTKLKIGTKQFAADTSLQNPTDFAAKVKVVGPFSSITWNGGYAEAVGFSVQVSVDNQSDAALLVNQDLSNTEVLFS